MKTLLTYLYTASLANWRTTGIAFALAVLEAWQSGQFDHATPAGVAVSVLIIALGMVAKDAKPKPPAPESLDLSVPVPQDTQRHQ